MKQQLLTLAAIAAVATVNFTSRADTYADPTGDTFAVDGILDITSVEVTNTATDLVFKIKVAGNPVATDWGKYMISIHSPNGPAGDLAGNGWGRPISVSNNVGTASAGMNYWVGTWVDSGNGAELRAYNAGWVLQSATYNPNPDLISITKTTNSVSVNFKYAGLGVNFGDTINFDVYTSGGGGGDSAVDALSRSSQSIANWGDAFVSTNLASYTLQTVTEVAHTVKFAVDMGVPVWEFDNPWTLKDGFNTNTDLVYVAANFNNFDTSNQLLRQGDTTVYTNTVTFMATPGDTIQYKFRGLGFPGYESPLSTGGNNRTLILTNTSITLPTVCFGDRCLTDSPTNTVKFAVNLSVARNFGVFDPSTNTVSLPGGYNNWDTGFLATEDAANPNVYTNTITFYYYPLSPQHVAGYKVKINNLANDFRDNGWEAPISYNGNNRSLSITSALQTLSFTYNDENPVINATVQQMNANDVKISFNSFPSRGGLPGYPTGGVYAVESRTSLTAPWTTNAIIHSTTGNTSITNTGVLPGTPQQFYRVGLIGL